MAGNAESYSTSILNFLRKFHKFIHSACIKLWSDQQCTRVPLSPHSFQHLMFLIFLIIELLTCVRGYLIVALIYISLMISDIKHIFIFLLAICVQLLKKIYLCSLPIFNDVVSFLLCYLCSFIFWILTTYWKYELQIPSPIN